MPVIVMVDFPNAADPLTARVNPLPEVAGFVANVAVTPAGNPLALRLTT